MNGDGSVTITEVEYERLLDADRWKRATETCSVVNWSGWEYVEEAYEELRERDWKR